MWNFFFKYMFFFHKFAKYMPFSKNLKNIRLSLNGPPTAPLSVHCSPTARYRCTADRQRAFPGPKAAVGLLFTDSKKNLQCIWFFGRTGHILSRIEMIQTSKLLVSMRRTTLMLNIFPLKIIFMDEFF